MLLNRGGDIFPLINFFWIDFHSDGAVLSCCCVCGHAKKPAVTMARCGHLPLIKERNCKSAMLSSLPRKFYKTQQELVFGKATRMSNTTKQLNNNNKGNTHKIWPCFSWGLFDTKHTSKYYCKTYYNNRCYMHEKPCQTHPISSTEMALILKMDCNLELYSNHTIFKGSKNRT